MREDWRDQKFDNEQPAFKQRREAAVGFAKGLNVEALAANTSEQITDSITEQYSAKQIRLDWESFELKTYEVRSHDKASGELSDELPKTLQVELLLRSHGAAHALKGVTSGGQGHGGRYWICYTIQLDPDAQESDFENLEQHLSDLKANWFSALEKARVDANAEIDHESRVLREAVMEVVGSRSVAIRALSRAANSLEIPLNQIDSNRVPIPTKPKGINILTVSASSDPGKEYELAPKIGDAMVSQIASFGAALSRLPLAANRLVGADEEAIRDVLLFILNANWENRVTGETFVGRGKTDLHMSWHNREAFIGECKIWSGSSNFGSAIDQLLGRYTVWNATQVALILFIRNIAGVTDVIEKAKSEIKDHSRFHAIAESVHEDIMTTHMRAQTDSRKLVKLSLIPVVIPDSDASVE